MTEGFVTRRAGVLVRDGRQDEPDATRRRESEGVAKSKLLQSVLDATDQGFGIFDENLQLIGWNRSYLDLMGVEQADAERGLVLRDIVHRCAVAGMFGPGDPDEHLRDRFNALQGPHRPPYEAFELKDGRQLECRRYNLPGGGFVATYSDVTARRRAEAVVQQNRETYHRLVETLPDAVYVTARRDGRILYANSAGVSLLGGESSEALRGEMLIDFLDVDLHDVVRDRLRCLIDARPIDSILTGRVVRLDGEMVHFEGTIVLGEYDAEHAFQWVLRDVTRRNKTEALLRDAIETMPDGFMLWGPDDRLVMTNQALRSSESEGAPPLESGMKFSEAMGERVWKGLVDGTRGRENEYIKDRLSRHRNPSGEPLERRLADGRWVEIREYRTGEGGIVAFRREITERKRVEEELYRHRSQLEGLVEERTRELGEAQQGRLRAERLATIGQLTGTVSHELRNPLGTIRSSFQIIRRHLGVAYGPVKRALDRIDRNIDRCVAIIEELLAYTRIRNLSVETIDLDSWCRVLLEDEALPGGVHLHFDCRSQRSVRVDRERFRQALINVFENAWQAADGRDEQPGPGNVIVATRATDERVEIRISDNGGGMPVEIQDRVFEPLFSTKPFGVGLGLPLVKQIMDQHSGGISVDSEEDQGTTVTLWLPINPTF